MPIQANSTNQQPSICSILCQLICPCLVALPRSSPSSPLSSPPYPPPIQMTAMPTSQTRVINTARSGWKPNIYGSYSKPADSAVSEDKNPKRKGVSKQKQLHSSLKRPFKLAEQLRFPINSFTQNCLLSVGTLSDHILLKITSVVIGPQAKNSSKKKSIQIRPEGRKEKYVEFEFNQFWDERYQLFEKFDEGIKIKEGSWKTLPSETLAEHIADKCSGAQVILDAFAEMGSISIPLANLNSCVRVIANEQDKQKIAFLLNNAAIYETEARMEISNQKFMEIDRKGVDVVVLHPSLDWSSQQQKIDAFLGKAMSLAPNIVMLLPPDTSPKLLASFLHKWARKLNWMKDFCSVSLEKVYERNELRWVLLSAGKLVQRQVRFRDELDFVYSRLKGTQDKVFRHKKIVKKIREDYGMLDVLSLTKLSEKVKRDAFFKNPVKSHVTPVIDFFYQIVLQRKMVSSFKIRQIRYENAQYENQSRWGYNQEVALDWPFQASGCEEEKVDNWMFSDEAEHTVSEYSYPSYFESIGGWSQKKSAWIEPASGSSGGVVIKRTSSIMESCPSGDESSGRNRTRKEERGSGFSSRPQLEQYRRQAT